MLNIKGTDIYLTRGNTAVIDITPFDETGQPIILENGDKVIFKIKTRIGDDRYKQILTNQDYDTAEDTSLNLVLRPTDTLGMCIGEYKYDCVIIFANGEAYTFIPESKFVLLEAIATINDLEGNNG